MEMLRYTISPLWFASLRCELVVIKESARGHFLFMVVMEIRKCMCTPSFTSMGHGLFESWRSEEVIIEKSAQGHFLFVVIMEILKYTYVPTFTCINGMMSKFEK